MYAGAQIGAATEELALRHYVGVLWRRKIAVIVTTIVVVVLGTLYAYSQATVYLATAKVLLAPSIAETILNPNPAAARTDPSGGSIQTELEVLRAPSTRQAAQEALGPGVTVDQLASSVAFEAVPDSSIVAITAVAAIPEEAARISGSYAETYITIRRERMTADLLRATEQVQTHLDEIRTQLVELDKPITDLDTQIGDENDATERELLIEQRDEAFRLSDGQRSSLQSRESSYASQLDQLRLASNVAATGGASLLAAPEIPLAPSGPAPAVVIVMSVLLGLVLGIAIAFLRDHYDDTIRGADDLKQLTPNLPLLGLIPSVKGRRRGQRSMLVSMTAPSSPPAEAYRSLRTSLQSVGPRLPGVVQVTSPNQGESKSATVSNLAIALARAGKRVIVVDCDLRAPRLHQFFALDNEVGLTSVLTGDARLADAVRQVPDEPRLAVVPSGPRTNDPAELLASSECSHILGLLAAEADVVLLDGPPVLNVTDAVVLAGHVDAVIMVVTANTTTRHSTDRAVDLLEQVNAPLVGNVLSQGR